MLEYTLLYTLGSCVNLSFLSILALFLSCEGEGNASNFNDNSKNKVITTTKAITY